MPNTEDIIDDNNTIDKQIDNPKKASRKARPNNTEKRKPGNGSSFYKKTTIALVATTFFLIICILILIIKLDNRKVPASSNEVVVATISDEERDSIKAEAKDEMLSGMKSHFANGGGPLSLMKSLFPNDIVFINSSGDYVFTPINENLKKNVKATENYSKDEDGFITYSENNQVVSHMGVDASRFQGNIDFAKLKKQGVEFAILRCGFRSYGNGVLNTDASFATFATNALKNDIPIGAYFFSSAITVEEAKEEADYVIDIIKPYKITYPVVLDFEEIDGDTYRQENLGVNELTDIIIAFCDKIEAAGYKPMIYSNLKGFIGRLDMARLEKYEKWFAYYDDAPYFPYEFSIWQYTSTAKLDGVSGSAIDMNISFKTYN